MLTRTIPVDVGRPGVFGNPWAIASVTVEEAVGNYALYFLERVKTDEVFRSLALDLHGRQLWCPGCKGTNADCHADVIRWWLRKNQTTRDLAWS